MTPRSSIYTHQLCDSDPDDEFSQLPEGGQPKSEQIPTDDDADTGSRTNLNVTSDETVSVTDHSNHCVEQGSGEQFSVIAVGDEEGEGGSPMNKSSEGTSSMVGATPTEGGTTVSDSDGGGGGVVERATSAGGAGSRASGTTASLVSTTSPTTTISTIAVQSGTTRVVLALLQVSYTRQYAEIYCILSSSSQHK